MSGNVKLIIRQPPHRDFVHGYPGLTGLRDVGEAKLHGTVEVRVGNSAVQAKYLHIELRKTETVSTSKGIRRYYELIGTQAEILWQPKNPDAEGFGGLDDSNHAFSIPVPAGLPPSIVADRSKNTGIVYHLCATLLAKPKSKISIFSGPPAKLPVAITQSAEILIEKHELNSTWPVYSWQAEEEALIHERANVEVRLRRDSVMYGSGDPVQFVLDFHNKRATATKINKVELTLREIVTAREVINPSSGPVASSTAGSPDSEARRTLQQVTEVFAIKVPVSKTLAAGTACSHIVRGSLPATHHRFTVQNAKHLEIRYVLRVRASVETTKEKKQPLSRRFSAYTSGVNGSASSNVVINGNGKADGSHRKELKLVEEQIKELIMDDIPVLISPWSSKLGEWYRSKLQEAPPHLLRPANAPTSPMQRLLSPSTKGADLPSVHIPAKRVAQSPVDVASPTFAGSRPNFTPNPAASRESDFTPKPAASREHRPAAASAMTPVEEQSEEPSIDEQSSDANRERVFSESLAAGRRLSSFPARVDGQDIEARYRPLSIQSPPLGASDMQNGFDRNAVMQRQGEQQLRLTRSHDEQQAGARPVSSRMSMSQSMESPVRDPPNRLQMDGAYPVFPKPSPVVQQHQNAVIPPRPTRAAPPPPPPAESDGVDSGGAAFGGESEADIGSTSDTGNSRQREPAVSKVPIHVSKRKSDDAMQPLMPSSVSNTNSAGIPPPRISAPRPKVTNMFSLMRSGTLSTITGSPPESPEDIMTRSPSLSFDTAAKQWPTAEQEKQRLVDNYNRQIASQQEDQIAHRHIDAIPEEPERPSLLHANDRNHSSALQRTTSNPIRSESGYEQGYGMNGDDTTGETPHQQSIAMSADVPYLDSARTMRHAAPSGLMSPASAEKSLFQIAATYPGVDQQKLLYLQALAEREAYQRKLAGASPKPLLALEEKRRLQSSVGSDVGGSANSNSQGGFSAYSANSASQQGSYYRAADVASSIYLTPSGEYNVRQRHGYIESPQSSSTHLPSSTSDHSQSSLGSWLRDPSIARGKQRNISVYESDDGRHSSRRSLAESKDGPPLPPRLPPKPKELLLDMYSHLDSPTEMRAADYEQHFARRSVAASTAY